MADAPSDTFSDLKNAYSSAKLPYNVAKFNITSIIGYFLKTHSDFRSIREVSFELFTNGHVQNVSVKEDVVAKKTLIRADCLAHMRQLKYSILIIIDESADICHASCRCEDGKGPASTCKHVAALCYALDDFVKTFVLQEDISSCTDKLEAWNKPRDVKLPATPIYDIDFERKRYGKKRKESRELKCAKPESYQLDRVCDSERSAVCDFITGLKQWSADKQKDVLLNTVVDVNNPVETVSSINPLYDYVTKFQSDLDGICSGDNIDLDSLKRRLKVTAEEQAVIQENTLLQSRASDWFLLRKYRITGSVVHRVYNFYTYKRANPNNISRSIISPTQFTSAATKLGLDLEPKVLERYLALKRTDHINLTQSGLMIDTDHGYLAASPDSVIMNGGRAIGLVEVKTKIADKWNTKSIQECLSDNLYPLKMVTVNYIDSVSRVIRLKENNQWFHQIQLQLYVCRDFATYCDLAVYHPGSDSFICARITPSEEWRAKFLQKFQQFYDNFMVPEIIEKHKK